MGGVGVGTLDPTRPEILGHVEEDNSHPGYICVSPRGLQIFRHGILGSSRGNEWDLSAVIQIYCTIRSLLEKTTLVIVREYTINNYIQVF